MGRKTSIIKNAFTISGNMLKFSKLQNVWSIRCIGVYSGYKSLKMIDEGSTGRHKKKLSVSNVEILNEKMGLVTFHCKDV